MTAGAVSRTLSVEWLVPGYPRGLLPGAPERLCQAIDHRIEGGALHGPITRPPGIVGRDEPVDVEVGTAVPRLTDIGITVAHLATLDFCPTARNGHAAAAATLRESAGRLAERARSESWSHEEYLAACLQREVAARDAHGGEGRIRAARFPARKRIEEEPVKSFV